ncbi:MAG: 3-alpha,7-alpha,12-alpha-trihydroxy-5-beta-cholest-24-enoyl-CoA hydratase [Alphaproteobacteria bacterium]|nr:3-alpha,7-alpha,12-alpha-trihydroxy-5-beta-cholest-24-enoyl-CoA hydratase [Alphaproteobacteria bacterium]
MTFDWKKLLAYKVPEIEQDYTAKDSILYALGIGLGADPMDAEQLRFVYEDGLKALPTMPVVLGYPGFWVKNPETGVDWKKVLHGEQGFILHKPVAPTGAVVGRSRLTAAVDKGAQTGLLLYSERDVFDRKTGDKLYTLTSTSVLRGNGGCGAPEGPVPPIHKVPERTPDTSCDLKTLPQAALIYRLSGDFNPLHADPAVAKTANFPRPILHGLCTYGVVGHALLRTMAGYDVARFKRMNARFTAPVFPGETIRTEMWREGAKVSFRARVVERDVVCINNGLAEIV